MVSDSDLADRLRQLLRTSDLRTTTATAVRRILEEEYGVDLSGRKAFIRRQIELFIDESAAENDGVYDVAEPVVAEEGAENVTNDKIGCEEDGGVREQVGEWGGKRRRKRRSDKVANAVKKKDRGFMKPCGLSPQLESFVGVSELARPEVYYSTHPLIPIDRVWGQKILCLQKSGLGQNILQHTPIVMVEEEVAAAASPMPLDHKQKHEDLELDAPEPPPTNANEMDLVKRDGKEEGNRAAAGGDSEESEAKRPRPKENSNGSVVTDNGFQEDKVETAELPSAENNTKSEDAQEQPAEEAADIENDKQPSSDDLLEEEIQSSLVENNLPESPQQQPSGAREHQEPLSGDPQPVDVYSEEQQPAFETQTASRKIKVPNIKADAGGFPSLVARGFSKIHAAGAAEQILIQVPNEKVGLIIGKDEETIKNLQTRSGAHIQLTPQHIPEGDHSKERTVRVFGDKKQTEMGREMIKEVMNQTVWSSSLSGGYNQQQQEFGPCGPAQPQWGNHQGGPHPSHSGGYNYQQRGSYPPPSQNSRYALPPQAYGGINHPPRQMEQRHPPSIMLQQGPGGCGHMGDVPASSHGQGPSPTPMGPPPRSQGNCNNYGQPQPAAPPYSSQAPQSHGHGHGYNKAKYENQALYHPSYGGGGSQPGPMGPGYPHPGYAPQDQLYGKAPVSYPQQHNGGLPQGTRPGDNISYHMSTVSVQAIQQQYPQNAAPPPQSQQTYPQTYLQQYPQNTAPPPPQSQQKYPQTYPQQYPQNAAPSPPQSQQTYPQTYPQPYVSDGYNINQQQLQPVATLSAAPVYPQQGPISGCGQQQQQRTLSGYAQEGPTGGYGSYPSGYTEQPTAQNTAAAAGYVSYQGSVVPAAAYASAPTQLLIGQTVYAQPAPTQPPTRYEPYNHSGNYGSARATYTLSTM